jgi:hypothetical protein
VANFNVTNFDAIASVIAIVVIVTPSVGAGEARDRRRNPQGQGR